MAKSFTVGVSLDENEMKLIQAISDRTGRTKSNIVRYIVKHFFYHVDDALVLCVDSFDRRDLYSYLCVKEVP